MGISGRFGSLNDRLQFNSRRSGEIKLNTAQTGTGGGRRGLQEDASLHQAGKDKDDKDRYAQVTLAGEEDKPEDGEEIEQRRGESTPRTTRKEV